MLREHVGDLAVSVNVSEINFRMSIEELERPIKVHPVGSCNMSHCRRSLFEDNFNGCLVVLAHG